MAERKLEELKIAVIHDHLEWKGGGERTALLMALSLGADFVTAYANPNTYPDYQKELGARFRVLTDKVVNKEVVRFFWMRFTFWRRRHWFKEYDILIASGQSAIEAVALFGKKGAVKMVYNHTPPRRVFDLYRPSRQRYKWFLRPLFTVFTWYWRWVYLQSLDRMDFDIANSENIRQRMLKHTKRDVNAIVWPPILTNKFRYLSDGDYFLSWGRLDENKRVELIVEAFKKMPDKKLVVASGGAYADKIKKLAEDCPNIKIVGWQEDEALFDLVGRCRAAIYIPIDEDAGMTHLEANAAGKPVLGVAEGGLNETIIDDQTGFRIKTNPTVEDVIEGVEKMTVQWCASKKEICIQHAAKFSEEVFVRKIKEIVLANHPDKPVVGVDASRWEDPRFSGEERRTGVEVYSKNLLEALADYLRKQPIRGRFYTPRTIPSLPLSLQKTIPPKKFWTWRGLGRELRIMPPASFFTPSYLIPRSSPKNSFVVIHDLIFKTNPEKYSWAERLKQEWAWWANRKRAKKIIAVSETVRAEIIKLYPELADRISVVTPGYHRQSVFEKEVKKEKRLIYVGRVEKKKSVGVLIQAFAEVAKEQTDWRLDIVGGDGHGAEEIKKLAQDLQVADKIIFHGYLSEEKKNELLARASIFVHPSATEGSCLPLLEAWDAGLAPVLADIAVMRELAGQGALYFKPDLADDLAAKINSLLSDSSRCQSLLVSGCKKLSEISWSESADKVGRIIME